MGKYWYKIGTVKRLRYGTYYGNRVTVVYPSLYRQKEGQSSYFIVGEHKIVKGSIVLVDNGRQPTESGRVTLSVEGEGTVAFDHINARFRKGGNQDELDVLFNNMGIMEGDLILDDFEWDEEEEDEDEIPHK